MNAKKEPMKIPFYTKGCKTNRLLDAFSLKNSHIITIVGAGGKTSLMLTLGQAFSLLGYKTLLTTTTHMYPPSFSGRNCFPDGTSLIQIEREDIAALRHSFRLGNLTALGIPLSPNAATENASSSSAPSRSLVSQKWGAPSLSFLREISDIPDIILCEGDGAKHFPLKLPRKQEPVFYPNTDTILGIIGLSALGKPASKTIFGLSEGRWSFPKSFLQDLDAPVTPEILFQIASSPCGLRKHISSEAFHILFNQADLLCGLPLAVMQKTTKKLRNAGFSCQLASLQHACLYGELPISP